MSSFIARIFGLKCVNLNNQIDNINPIVCITKGGHMINPYWILTADIFLVVGILILIYVAYNKIKEKYFK